MAEAQPAEFAQATDLEQAFDVFNALSERLTLAYGQLEARVAMLSDQLDSTRRDRLRERAQKEHLADQLGVLLEALPAAVVLVDMRDRIDRFNPAAEQLFPGLAWGRRWSEVKAEVVGLLEDLRRERPNFVYEIRDVLEFLPTLTDAAAPVVKAVEEGIREVLGKQAQQVVSPGTYDQKHIFRVGHLEDCIAYGPGILDLAHQPDEYVAIDDMVNSAKVMAAAALTLLNGGAA